jgi:hypothetical protein
MLIWEWLGKFGNWLFKYSPIYKEYQAIKNDYQAVKQERDELKKLLDIRKGLSFEHGLYWDRTNPQDPGPFCQVCIDGKRGRQHLQGSNEKGWDCLECKNYFSTERSEHRDKEALDDLNKNPGGPWW